jgi:class 3 adenylate cyclase/YHS domain-containing protein
VTHEATRERALIIADLAGYTALTEAHGGAEAARTVGRYLELASQALGAGCRLVERVGDQLLLVAEEIEDAARTAIALREATEQEPRFPSVRIGIDAGETLEQDGHYFGSALNIAARVAAYARPGQILCTERVATALKQVSPMECQFVGAVHFKNVSDPVRVFELAASREHGAVVDPVCRMRLQPDTSVARLPLGGRTYYFCSLDCAQRFASRPDVYAEPQAP